MGYDMIVYEEVMVWIEEKMTENKLRWFGHKKKATKSTDEESRLHGF